jgi:hypothetical protein
MVDKFQSQISQKQKENDKKVEEFKATQEIEVAVIVAEENTKPNHIKNAI